MDKSDVPLEQAYISAILRAIFLVVPCQLIDVRQNVRGVKSKPQNISSDLDNSHFLRLPCADVDIVVLSSHPRHFVGKELYCK